MQPATHNFQWYEGDVITGKVILPYNLTGAAIKMQVKDTAGLVLLELLNADFDIEINQPVSGSTRLGFKDLTSLEFTALKVKNCYDLQIIFSGETLPRTYLAGSVIICKQVTT